MTVDYWPRCRVRKVGTIPSVRPVVSVPSSPSSSSVRPSVPSSVPSSSVLCLYVLLCPVRRRPSSSVVVVRPLSVRPVVRPIVVVRPLSVRPYRRPSRRRRPFSVRPSRRPSKYYLQTTSVGYPPPFSGKRTNETPPYIYIYNVVSRLRKVDPPPARQRKVSRIADFAYFIIFLIGLPLADFLFFFFGGGGTIFYLSFIHI